MLARIRLRGGLFAAFLLASLLWLVGAATPALAGTPNPLVHQATLLAQQHHAEIAQAVALVLGWLASHVTALLTHWSAPPKVKAAIAAGLSTLAGVVASVLWAPGQPWYDWVVAIFYAVISSQIAYMLRNIPVIGVATTQLIGGEVGKTIDAPTPQAAVDAGLVDAVGAATAAGSDQHAAVPPLLPPPPVLSGS